MLGKSQNCAIDLTMFGEQFTNLGEEFSVAMETNGKGFLGFVVELPGAFVRGRTEDEAFSKVDREAKSYLSWLGIKYGRRCRATIVQRHRCSLMVDDADSEILLDDDRRSTSPEELERLAKVVVYSGQTFLKLYRAAKFKDWVERAKIRNTFYGRTPRTIHEIFEHIKRTQYYYLSRAGIDFKQEEESFMKIRMFCLKELKQLFKRSGNSLLFDIDNERWTLKKILRRFIWHDRIHGKAIVRILDEQRQLGLIDTYSDPFCFSLL